MVTAINYVVSKARIGSVPTCSIRIKKINLFFNVFFFKINKRCTCDSHCDQLDVVALLYPFADGLVFLDERWAAAACDV